MFILFFVNYYTKVSLITHVKSSGFLRSSADAGMNWTPGICFSKRKGNFLSKMEALDSDISNNENHPIPSESTKLRNRLEIHNTTLI